MRCPDLCIDVQCTLAELPSGQIIINARTTHPVHCYGKVDVSFEDTGGQAGRGYVKLLEAARVAGNGGCLRLRVDGEVVLGHISSESEGPPEYKFTLEVERVNSAYPMVRTNS